MTISDWDTEALIAEAKLAGEHAGRAAAVRPGTPAARDISLASTVAVRRILDRYTQRAQIAVRLRAAYELEFVDRFTETRDALTSSPPGRTRAQT